MAYRKMKNHHLFDSFPREVGLPRRLVWNRQQMMEYLNKKNGFASVYSTVYSFDGRDEIKPWLADYKTAHIDKLFLDLDGAESFDQLEKYMDYNLKKDLVFRMQLSAGGYHGFTFSKERIFSNPKVALELSQWHIINGSGIRKEDVDRKVIGDIARVTRVTYTRNMKRKAFCIPVTIEMVDKGDDYIRKKSKEKSVKRLLLKDWIYGRELFDMKPFDREPTFDHTTQFIAPIIKDKNGVKIDRIEEIIDRHVECLALKDIFRDPNASYRARYHLILFLKEMGYSLEEVKQVLSLFLTPSKLEHCLFEERQPDYIFSRDDLFMATCKVMKKDELCNYNCKGEECKLEMIYV